MKDEAISSSGDPFALYPLKSSSPPPPSTPAASSVGASSPAPLRSTVGRDWQELGQGSKGCSISHIGSHPIRASLSTSAGGSALGSSQPSCRPWERGDLLRRLSTFEPENWFGKPKAASSLACARRGWVNVNVDKIACESCGTNLKFVMPATMTLSEADSAGEDFLKKIDGHKMSCPWRGNSCVESLVQFPPTPPFALIGGFKDRCDGLIQFPFLPIVAASAIDQIRISHCPEIDRLLAQRLVFGGGESGFKCDLISGSDSIQEDIIFRYSRAQKLISLCGWEPRWLPNIQDCEEHSAQSARNGYSVGEFNHRGLPHDRAHGKRPLSSSSTRKEFVKNDLPGTSSKGESRSPLLDCSLCGATVRIWDFLTVARPSCFAPNNVDIPETSKKMLLTCGASAASGINGRVSLDDVEKEQMEDQDEYGMTNEGKSLSNVGLDLNLSVAGGLSSSHLGKRVISDQQEDVHIGRGLTGQLSSSELGGRAASYESRGPTTRKRNLEEGGSTVDRSPLVVQQADSVEGTVIDHDGDEVDDGKQYSAGPSKRTRGFDIFDSYQSPTQRDPFGAGPSQPLDFLIGTDVSRDDPFDQGQEVPGFPTTRDSTRASSVIAMDTICQSADDDSMESVENFPVEIDDAYFPSTSTTIRNMDLNETSEPNYSNQAQQSTCPGGVGDMGVSSTNEEEVLNADNVTTTHGRDGGPSFGISAGSVGMGASHEAEIHGVDASIHISDSFVGDVEPVPEITENQGLTSEFAQNPGIMGDFVPEEVDREDPHGDSQDLMSGSVRRADSGGSKIIGSAKAEESFESGEKSSKIHFLPNENSVHLSLSCNAVLCSGFDASKGEVNQAGKEPPTDECGFVESHYFTANALGPPNGESNYEEVIEFDPIKHHNPFCPWVNGNVAAAGCSSSGGGSTSGVVAFCGWQLTLDALDAFHESGQLPNQNVESESAASLCKDDHLTSGKKLLAHHSFSTSHGPS